MQTSVIDNLEPNPKNPIIAAFFRNIGYAVYTKYKSIIYYLSHILLSYKLLVFLIIHYLPFLQELSLHIFALP